MSRAPGLVLALGILLAGCVTESADLPQLSETDRQIRPTVIALLDSGVNPYLPIYLSTGPSEYVPPEAIVIQLSQGGDHADRLRADEATWNSVEIGKLYHLDGTRLSAITFSAGDRLLDEEVGHGAHTAYLAARDAPAVHIVMVQVLGAVCTSGECLVSPTVAEGMEWIAAQPWIDVVSVSIGFPANAPDRPEAHPEMARYLNATRSAAAAGKLLVNGAGNDPSPSLTDYFDGPPHMITVGGIDPVTRGETATASKLVDVVSNYVELTPDADSVNDSDGVGWRTGTSFATPVVAATLAAALDRARAAGANPSMSELRTSMNASALSLAASDWAPTPPERRGTPWDQLNPTLPILVQPQMGWGYVNASLADEIARRVIEQDFTIPPGKDQAQLFQPAWQQAREEFWRHWAPT